MSNLVGVEPLIPITAYIDMPFYAYKTSSGYNSF